MNRVTFVARLQDDFFGERPIGKSRKAQNARRVGRCGVAAKLIGKGAE
jgi:hypothetical protein